MLRATVTGKVWATRKTEGLTGVPLLVTQTPEGTVCICADCVGAGEGEQVLIAPGSAARLAVGKALPVDAAIIAILDPQPEGRIP